MKNIIDIANSAWQNADPIGLASYVMWAINYIHPFVNGNGRTSRAMFYYVFCMKLKAKISIPLPELIRTRHRADYIAAMQRVDATVNESFNIRPLANLMEQVIFEAIDS